MSGRPTHSPMGGMSLSKFWSDGGLCVMLHSVGEYEAGLIERYREARARLSPPPKRAPKVSVPVRRIRPKIFPVFTAPALEPMEWPAQAPAVPYDHFEVKIRQHPMVWKMILHEVAEGHEIPVEALVGPGRQKRFANARAEASFRLVVEGGLSLPQAGRRLGDRDHTTILYFVRKHAAGSEEAGRVYTKWLAAREADRAHRRAEAVRLWREGKTIDQIAYRVTLSKGTILRAITEAGERQI